MDNKALFNHIYSGRNRIIILGLTGRTGSGCTTVASILSRETFSELDIKPAKSYDYKDKEERKKAIILEYMQHEDRWKQFNVIDISSLIICAALDSTLYKLISYINKITKNHKDRLNILGDKSELWADLRKIKEMSRQVRNFSLEFVDINKMQPHKVEEYYDFYTKDLEEIKSTFKHLLENKVCFKYSEKTRTKEKYNLYTYLLQNIGNNLRCCNDPFDDSTEFDEKKFEAYLKRINNLIKIINKYNENNGNRTTRICIDAIRNPYEAMYFRDKYRYFYLIAIKCEETDRSKRLRNITKNELDNIDRIENDEDIKLLESLYRQDIQACVQIADIHIYNPQVYNHKYFQLTDQIVKYLALILHPGLITPTSIERCMQLAYSAKLNSGCLSRQVGAVVTRDDYSIQSIGWNDVPEGQAPCYLRDTDMYCSCKDENMFSEFELNNENMDKALTHINEAVKGKLDGLTMPYCFKDVYNSIKGKNNQVYTRALHAEENAFLQISKYGGQTVKNGCLFTTASPCELCAKKAYQLGIRKIYYIDPYPGISKEHILSCGSGDKPEMIFFQGAIGCAYIDFYSPRMQRKDELEIVTGIRVKKFIANIFSEENS